MNKIHLIGRLTADPELLETNSNISYCRFTLAVNRPKDKDGNQVADFFRVTAWRGAADIIARYVKKGERLAIVGSIHFNKYTDKDGIERQSADVTVQDFELLGDRNSEDKPKQESKPKPRLEPYDGMEDDSPF